MSSASFCPQAASNIASPSCHGREESTPVVENSFSLPENKNTHCLKNCMAKAFAAWGEPLPDWIAALARACDEEGLRKTAAKVGVSPALASLAVNKQRDKLDYIKARVERTIMVTIVACPVLGVMSREQCLQEQRKAFTAANPLRVQLFRACRNGCKQYKILKKQ